MTHTQGEGAAFSLGDSARRSREKIATPTPRGLGHSTALVLVRLAGGGATSVEEEVDKADMFKSF